MSKEGWRAITVIIFICCSTFLVYTVIDAKQISEGDTVAAITSVYIIIRDIMNNKGG